MGVFIQTVGYFGGSRYMQSEVGQCFYAQAEWNHGHRLCMRGGFLFYNPLLQGFFTVSDFKVSDK